MPADCSLTLERTHSIYREHTLWTAYCLLGEFGGTTRQARNAADYGLGFRVQVLGFRVQVLGFR